MSLFDLTLDSSATPAPLSVPADFNEYYARIVRTCIRSACPAAALAFLLFFGWDCLFAQSGSSLLVIATIRIAVALALIGFWYLEPHLGSLRTLVLAECCLYVFVMLALIAILSILPGGLGSGIAAILLVIMFASGTLCLRPVAALLSGAVALAAYEIACKLRGVDTVTQASCSILFVAGMVIASFFLFLLQREIRQKHSLELALQAEKEQSEVLVKEMLPRYIIQRIHEGADNIAESISEVNIIFIDIVGFTELSTKLAPKHIVEILSEIFTAFDDLCERHSVTKIKTIGDAYMAATGAPEPSTCSAVSAVEFCSDAIEAIAGLAQRIGVPIRIRAGVATGSAISGVLSLKKPTYDLWGETVNLAARMESTGVPGQIHIAESTYWRVKNTFECRSRGRIDVKGMGRVETYIVRPHQARAAIGAVEDLSFQEGNMDL